MMRWNPQSPLSDLFDDIFGNTNKDSMKQKSYECAPSTNILEKAEGFELQMAVPGVNKKDIKIDLEKNILSISSEKSADDKEEAVKYSRREFSYGTFCRQFNLPDTIDSEKISAEVTDGILSVMLPRKEKTKISKEIKIS